MLRVMKESLENQDQNGVVEEMEKMSREYPPRDQRGRALGPYCGPRPQCSRRRPGSACWWVKY